MIQSSEFIFFKYGFSKILSVKNLILKINLFQSWLSQSHDKNDSVDLKRVCPVDSHFDRGQTLRPSDPYKSMSTTTCFADNSLDQESSFSSFKANHNLQLKNTHRIPVEKSLQPSSSEATTLLDSGVETTTIKQQRQESSTVQ